MRLIKRLFYRAPQLPSAQTGVSVIVPLSGRLSELEYQAALLISELNKWAAAHVEHEVILIPDGRSWAHIARGACPPVHVIAETPDASHLPGRLLNLGVRAATKPCIAIGLIGVDAAAWLANIERLAAQFSPDSVGVAGRRGKNELHEGHIESHRVRWHAEGTPDPRYGLAECPSGWLEMLDLVPMHNTLVNREKLLVQGGFSEVSPTGYWWQACLALARQGPFTEVDIKPPLSRYRLEQYPIDCQLLPVDMTARIAVRAHRPDDLKPLYNDLPELHGDTDRRDGGPIKVTVLGGPFEPHHTQIFFFNMFRRVEGQSILSWRVIDDEYATPQDIEQADLVIYCRVRSTNGCALLDYARTLRTPVLYMLDDNWFTIGRDWEEYAELIVPGAPFYDNALYCIRNADAIVTYSPVMREYFMPHARHVFLQTMPVDLSAFTATPSKRAGLMIGYAGSPRRNDTALRALVELARRHPTLTIFYFGWAVPPLLQKIPAAQLQILHGTHSFTHYARRLAQLAPDIGFAPLERTETDRAKNPTKYLDYAAVKCAGIYSDIEPYTRAVKHGQTGLLIAGETVEEWVDAAETLMGDRALLDRIRAQCHEDVRCTYEVDVLLPAFLDMLRRVYERRF